MAPDRLRFDFVHSSPVTRDQIVEIERLVNDRHYFARPARTLFNDIRRYFPMTAQARVWVVTQRFVSCVEEWLDRLRGLRRRR